jgi:hypothetical protein
MKKINVFFNLKKINRIYVNKDSTEAHFSIYVEKYQKARDKATTDYYKDPSDRNSVGIPNFCGKLY